LIDANFLTHFEGIAEIQMMQMAVFVALDMPSFLFMIPMEHGSPQLPLVIQVVACWNGLMILVTIFQRALLGLQPWCMVVISYFYRFCGTHVSSIWQLPASKFLVFRLAPSI
jgi:hypothetical protein